MKSKLLFIFIVIFVCIVSSNIAIGAETIKLNIWAGNWVLPNSPDPVQAKAVKDLFDEFQMLHPEIQLIYDAMPGYEESKDKLFTSAQAGNLPDVIFPDCAWIQLLGEMGVLHPLNDLWDKEDQKDFYEVFMNGVTNSKTGDIYGVWCDTDTRLLYYREDYFQESGVVTPKTWEEMIEAAKKLQTPDRYGLLYPGGMAEGTSVTAILPLFWGLGGAEFDADLKPIFNEGENREAMIKTLNLLSDLVNVHKVTPLEVLNIIGEDGQGQWVYSGATAMFLGGSWQYQMIEQNAPQDYDKWAGTYYPMPVDAPYEQYTHIGGWTYAISTKDPDKVNPAWEFIKFINSPKSMAIYLAAKPGLPTRRSVYTMDEFKVPKKWYDIFAEQLNFAQARKPSSVWPTMSTALQKALGEVASQRQTAEQAMDEAAKTVMDAFERLESR